MPSYASLLRKKTSGSGAEVQQRPLGAIVRAQSAPSGWGKPSQTQSSHSAPPSKIPTPSSSSNKPPPVNRAPSWAKMLQTNRHTHTSSSPSNTTSQQQNSSSRSNPSFVRAQSYSSNNGGNSAKGSSGLRRVGSRGKYLNMTDEVHNLNRVGKARETKAAERLLGVGKQPTTEHALHYFRDVDPSVADEVLNHDSMFEGFCRLLKYEPLPPDNAHMLNIEILAKTHFLPRFIKGRLLYHNQEYQEAKRVFESCLISFADSLHACSASKTHHFLAWCWYRTKKFVESKQNSEHHVNEKIEQHARTAKRISPALIESDYILGVYKKAMYSEMLRCRSHKQASSYREEAIAHFQRAIDAHIENRREVAFEYDNELDFCESYYKSYAILAQLHMNQDVDRCMQLCRVAIAYQPLKAFAYEVAGRAHCKTRQFEKAMEQADKGLQNNPNCGKLNALRGRCFYELRRFGDAHVCFTRAVECGEPSKANLSFLKQCEKKMGKERDERKSLQIESLCVTPSPSE